MYTKQPKKLLIMNILDILRKDTDENHRLSQQDIVDILKREYDMSADRKSVRRNILNLIDCGYDIAYSETVRSIPVKGEDGAPLINAKTGKKVTEESTIMTDFYLKNKFTDGELRLLIDSLLFSRHIPYNQCKELVKKLEGLSNKYFKSRVKHISLLSEKKTVNRQLFFNIEMLDDAISKKRKISFHYIEYGTDKKFRNKKCADGTDRVYTVSPYQMAARDGNYYLICSHDKYNEISNYRIDRIRDIEVLEEKAKPFENLKDAGGRSLDLGKYMQEHVQMYAGESGRVKFRIPKEMIIDIMDLFGENVHFSDEDDKSVSVAVYMNEKSAVQYAKSYGPDVILLEPQKLADMVREEMEQSLERYNK